MAKRATRAKKVSVLIVEDDSTSRKALTWLLKELGFDPVVVGDFGIGAQGPLSHVATNPDIGCDAA